MKPVGFVAELKVENDVELELGLARYPYVMQLLDWLAQQGGEVAWSARSAHPNTKIVVDGVVKLELCEIATHDIAHAWGTKYLRLTDKGRNVLSIHKQRKVIIGPMREVSAEEALDALAKASAAAPAATVSKPPEKG